MRCTSSLVDPSLHDTDHDRMRACELRQVMHNLVLCSCTHKFSTHVHPSGRKTHPDTSLLWWHTATPYTTCDLPNRLAWRRHQLWCLDWLRRQQPIAALATLAGLSDNSRSHWVDDNRAYKMILDNTNLIPNTFSAEWLPDSSIWHGQFSHNFCFLSPRTWMEKSRNNDGCSFSSLLGILKAKTINYSLCLLSRKLLWIYPSSLPRTRHVDTFFGGFYLEPFKIDRFLHFFSQMVPQTRLNCIFREGERHRPSASEQMKQIVFWMS